MDGYVPIIQAEQQFDSELHQRLHTNTENVITQSLETGRISVLDT